MHFVRLYSSSEVTHHESCVATELESCVRARCMCTKLMSWCCNPKNDKAAVSFGRPENNKKRALWVLDNVLCTSANHVLLEDRT